MFITVRLSDNVIPPPTMLLRLSDIVICHIFSADDQVTIVIQCSQIFVTIPYGENRALFHLCP